MFADSLKDRRVVLPADGFFEWSRDDKKTKYLFTLESLQTIYLCGVYKIIEGKYRFVILTRPANESMIEIHDRMPVIIKEEEVRPYLTDQRVAYELIAIANPLMHKERQGE